MNKQISNAGIQLVKYFEGCILTAYWDATGHVWTIGIGHTGPDVYEGLIITEYAAEQLLRTDMLDSDQIVNSNVLVELNQGQFDAISSFTFNGGLGMLQGGMLDHLNASDFTWVSNHFVDYCYSGGVYLEGLYNRRVKEKELFDTGMFNGTPADGGGTTPPGATTIKLKNNYLYGREDKLFGVKFISKNKTFTLVKKYGNIAIIKDGNKTYKVNVINIK